jgi:hypothetical protein
MRSELVFAAKRRLPGRYALCRIAATATRKFHRPNTRIEDTTDSVLKRIADSEPNSVSPAGRETSPVDQQTLEAAL